MQNMFPSPSPELRALVDYERRTKSTRTREAPAVLSAIPSELGILCAEDGARIGDQSSVAAVDLNRHRRFR
jgi:hypothetical protein